jgi:diacylglycerol kinase (ATP)
VGAARAATGGDPVRWLAIANPAAGRAREAERLVGRLRTVDGLAVEVARTVAPRDATRIAREATAFDGVIAIGGDGTIAEVLAGMDLGRQHLAVLPAGHGNCLARDLGVADPAAALSALLRGTCRPLDLMEVTIGHVDGGSQRRLCASTLALGYVADVVSFGRRRLNRLGRAAYATAALVVVPREFEARVSGSAGCDESRRYTGLVINNTAHLANFRGFPRASVHDGILDVMEQGHRWPRQLLHNLAVLAGSEAFGPMRLRQSRSERLDLGQAHTLMADGEMLESVSRVAVECRPGAVRCVVGSA